MAQSDSLASVEALKRVAEAEQRIRSLANEVSKSEGIMAADHADWRLKTRREASAAARLAARNASSRDSPPLVMNNKYGVFPPILASDSTDSEPCLTNNNKDTTNGMLFRLSLRIGTLETRVEEQDRLISMLLKEVKVSRENGGTQKVNSPAIQFTQPSPRRKSSETQQEDDTDLRVESLLQIPSTRSMGQSSGAPTPTYQGEDATLLRNVMFIHQAFDSRNGGYLSFRDAKQFQLVTEQTDLSLGEYVEFCAYLDADPDGGLEVADLLRMYRDPRLQADVQRDTKLTRKYVCTCSILFACQ